MPADNLIAWYPFNGNANDSSGNGHNGKVHGTAILAADRFGNANSAYGFDGHDTIMADSSSVFAKTNNRSISAWVLSTATGDQGIAGYIGTNGRGGFLLMVHNSGKMVLMEDWQTSWGYTMSNQTLAGDGKWHHLVGLRRNDTTFLYVDGVRQTSFLVQGATFSANAKVVIGSSLDPQAGYPQNLTGKVDEVRFYNRSLTDSEIQALFREPSPKLIAWYPFTGNANDSSGNGHNGTVSGAVLTIDRFGNANTAYSFNGSNSIITAPSAPSFLRSNNRTVCAWVLSSSTQESGIAGCIGASSGHDGYLLMLKGTTGKFLMLEDNYNNGAGSWDGPSSNQVYGGDGLWHHVAGVRRNDTTYLFVDGVKQTGFTTRSATTFPGSVIVIGAAIASSPTLHQFFNGKLDDVRFYSTALADTTIQTLANDLPSLIRNSISINNSLSGKVLTFSNPTASAIKIQFVNQIPGHVEITVLNAQGQEVHQVFDGLTTSGRQEFIWDGTNTLGQRVVNGNYFVRVQMPDGHQVINPLTIAK